MDVVALDREEATLLSTPPPAQPPPGPCYWMRSWCWTTRNNVVINPPPPRQAPVVTYTAQRSNFVVNPCHQPPPVPCYCKWSCCTAKQRYYQPPPTPPRPLTPEVLWLWSMLLSIPPHPTPRAPSVTGSGRAGPRETTILSTPPPPPTQQGCGRKWPMTWAQVTRNDVGTNAKTSHVFLTFSVSEHCRSKNISLEGLSCVPSLEGRGPLEVRPEGPRTTTHLKGPAREA